MTIMLSTVVNWGEGFVTWQTPVSFLAGVGTHHLYRKYVRGEDEEGSDHVPQEG